MKYLTTDHAVERTKQRLWIKWDNRAKRKCIMLFKQLRKCFRKKENYKTREVKLYLSEWFTYKLTDWKHKFIFEKLLWEILIVTYYKKTKIDKIIHNIIKSN